MSRLSHDELKRRLLDTRYSLTEVYDGVLATTIQGRAVDFFADRRGLFAVVVFSNGKCAYFSAADFACDRGVPLYPVR